MSSPGFNPYGAVDLSALAARSSTPMAASGSGSGIAVDVTETTFQAEVLDRSRTVPVVVDFATRRAPTSAQLSGLLDTVVASYAGRLALARVDVDAQPRLAQAIGLQQLPTVLAVVGGEALPLFGGPLPEADMRQVLDQLLAVAAQRGITGSAQPGAADPGDPPADPPHDPRYDAAYDAIEAGDFDAAAAAYRALLADAPADAEAKAGLAQVELLRRTATADGVAARAAADRDPADVEAVLLAADFDVLDNHLDAAFARLIAAIRATSGDERERLRLRLLELFEVVGSGDQRVSKARAALTSALF